MRRKSLKVNKDAELELVSESINQIISLQNKEKLIKSEINGLKSFVKKHMKDNEKDFIEFEYDESYNVKALRYEQNKIEYDDNIFDYLKKKKLLNKACKIVIDENKLEDLYNIGIIKPEDLVDYITIKNTEAFKVSLIKK